MALETGFPLAPAVVLQPGREAVSWALGTMASPGLALILEVAKVPEAEPLPELVVVEV
jgi:hypothetical protein